MAHNKEDWRNIHDLVENQETYVDYLETAIEQTEVNRYKKKSYQLLNLKSGSSVLDIGCGTGDDVLAIAELVGREGKVVGIDNSKSMIEKASQKSNQKQLPVQFRVADVYNLDFADNTFDGCRADRVFMHLQDRQQALSEMIRITRPCGRIVVIDPDWDTMIVEAPDRNLTRRILNNFVDQLLLNPWCGRELYKLFQQARLENVVVADAATLVLTDFSTAKQLMRFDKAANLLREKKPSLSDKVESWLNYLKQADENGFFFSAATMFTVVGEKSS
jgi:ubiquinone/menaquinone biosynthesis C-methylase UbiE